MTVPFFIAGGIVVVGVLMLSVQGPMLQRAVRDQSAARSALEPT